MPALYTITTRASGTILTAAIYNADHQNHVNNGDAQHHGGFSANVSQMQTITDPGDIGTESLAASVSDELARMRFVIQRLRGSTYWYSGMSGGGGGIGGNVVTTFNTRTGAVTLTSADITAAGGALQTATPGNQYQMVRFNASNQLAAENAPYDLCFSTPDSLTYTNSQVIVRHVPVHPFSLPASLTGSMAACVVAPTGSITFGLAKNGSSIGTINIAASATTGTFTFASPVTFAALDVLTITAPASADATLAGLYASFLGTRQ